MNAIKWGRTDGLGGRNATVEGVKVRRMKWVGHHSLEVAMDGARDVIINIPHLNRQQIDAAAYALADLVATLKGME